MPLMIAIYVGFSVIENPHGPIALGFSLFPLTSPIVMLMRIPFGVPWWQIAVSMALLFNGVDSFPESGHLVMSVACGYVFAGMSCQLHSEFFADAFVRHC